MNLWGKIVGLGALAAIALWGCKDDESNFLGFKNPNNKFNVVYTEIEVPSTVMLVDSVRTYNDPSQRSAPRKTVIGKYSDPLLGEIRAEMYTQFRPTDPKVQIPSEARFISAFFKLTLDYDYYGTNDVSTVDFSIHELTDSIRTVIDRDLLPNNVRDIPNYSPIYFNTSVPYDPTPLGQSSYQVDPERFRLFKGFFDNPTDFNITDLDSLVIPLNGEFGERLFNDARDQSLTYSNFSLFKRIYKGFAIVPESGTKIISFNPENDSTTNSGSELVINYVQFDETLQRDVTKVLEYTFYKFGDNSFHVNYTKFDADRSATALGLLTQPNIEFEPLDNMRYYQSGNPVVTKVDFGKFLEFIDTIPNVIFNSVELSIELEDFDAFEPPSSLRLRLLNENNDFLNFFSRNLDEANTPVFGGSMTFDEQGWFIVGVRLNTNEVNTTFDIKYDAEAHTYRGDLTDFFQAINAVSKSDFANKEEQLFTKFALVASDQPIGMSVQRAVFKKENIKLKVFFTTPAADNL